jgi:GAF domain-containing protein
MYDHRLFVRTTSELARRLLAPYDVAAALNELAERLTEVLALAGSGVTVADEDDVLRAVTAVPRLLAPVESYQEEHQAGPCYDAFATGRRLLVEDLSTESGRWPGYYRVAAGLGLGAVAAFPLQLGDRVFGAVNLYSAGPRRWEDDDVAAASVLSDMATAFLVNASSYRQQEQLTEQLQRALDSRVVIEQAKGVLAEAHGMDVTDAFEIIRRHARHHSIPVREVAAAVVAGDLRI